MPETTVLAAPDEQVWRLLGLPAEPSAKPAAGAPQPSKDLDPALL